MDQPDGGSRKEDKKNQDNAGAYSLLR